jgi:signal transduction histidine kinase
MRRVRVSQPRTIRGTLFVLIAIALLPLVGFGAYGVFDAYRHERDAEIDASADVANALVSAFESFILDLVRTEQGAAASFATRARTPRQIRDELVQIEAHLPMVRDMSWLDARGVAVASTEPRLVGRSFYAREYFREISAGAEWRVSPLVRSLLDARPLFIVASAYRRRSGELVGVVAAAVDAEKLAPLLSQRSSGRTSILDSEGTLVAVQPQQQALEWEARRRPIQHPWIRKALGGKGAHGVFRSPRTGDLRVGAIVPIPIIGWVAHASRPLDEAMAPVRRGLVRSIGALIAVALAALAAALVFARRIAEPLQALEQHAERLARSGAAELPARGPPEVRRVARALDSMASGLAARQADLEAVNRRLVESEERFRLAAEQAQAQRAELEALFAAVPAGLVFVDRDAAPVRSNDAARTILGVGQEELRRWVAEGTSRISGQDGRPLPPEDAPHARAVRGELVRGVILRVDRPPGVDPPSSVWIAASAAPIRDGSGAVRGAVTAFMDITELRNLQEERETLMQTVSHDLRTPLHVIVGHARLLRHRGNDDTQRHGDAILASAGRMKRLIEDLVDAARLETGHVALHLEPLDLRAFLSGWSERMVGALDTSRIRIVVPGTVPLVHADAGRFEQILVNLVSNALKYSLRGTEVAVTLTVAGESVRISVQDRGPGIAPEELPRLFERYYRAKTATHTEGLGLGLFITRKLVEAHGWRLEVESELGQGSVFTIVVPLAGGRVATSTAA